MTEFERIAKRATCSGEGDCENCSCWGSCPYGRTLPEDNYYDEDEQ